MDVTILVSVPNRTSNKVDKSRYRLFKRLVLFRKTFYMSVKDKNFK